MRLFATAFAVLGVALLVTTGTNHAQDKKDTVLKGRITCNKCERAESAECQTVIVVKDEKEKKDIVYFFDKKSDAKWHDDICTAGKNGTVVGTVKDEGKKKIISVKKVDYDK